MYVAPSTTTEPTGLAVTVIETGAGYEVVVLAEVAVDVKVELLLELAVVDVVVSLIDTTVEFVVVVLVVCDPTVNV